MPSNSEVSSLSRWLASTVSTSAIARARTARRRHERRASLAHVHARGDAADLGDRAAEQRLVDVGVDRREVRVRIGWRRTRSGWPAAAAGGVPGPSVRVRPARLHLARRPTWSARTARTAAAAPADPAGGAIQLSRLPRPEARLDLLGELVRVGGSLVRFSGDHRRGLMVLASARAVDAERDDDVGAEGPDVPDEVAEDLAPAPLLAAFPRG